VSGDSVTAADPSAGSGTAGPRGGVLEEAQVRAMFDRIAGFYDRMNSVMTAGLHHAWRRRAADLAAVGPGARVLDVATGTGDLAFELARRVGPSGEVVASDFSERMLDLARAKPGASSVRFETANALALPYRDDEFDAATVGFGARNFSDLSGGLREMVRVVRPGGRVVVLEITTPQRPPLSTFFELWFDRAVPALGRLAGDSAAYEYLPASVRRFPGPAALAGVMWEAGLRDVRYVLTAGGIIALHSGTVESGSGGPGRSTASEPDSIGSSPSGGSDVERDRANSRAQEFGP
jgi:demethylmenaquinone methyltransferase/2-methoxy-6-polyprenyl-1,4-benzoquinol methylase